MRRAPRTSGGSAGLACMRASAAPVSQMSKRTRRDCQKVGQSALAIVTPVAIAGAPTGEFARPMVTNRHVDEER